MTLIEWLVIGFFAGLGLAFVVCFVLGLCRVAGEADDAAERMYRSFRAEEKRQ
jgi:hypothetical protein